MSYPRPRIALLFLVALVLAPPPARALDAPHDPTNLPQVCATCHITHSAYGALLNPAVGDSIVNLCQSCHYPGGPGRAVSTHQCDAATDPACRHTFSVSCTACHDPHSQDQAANGSTYGKLIKDPVTAPDGSVWPVVLLGATGPGSFADGDATIDGICEVCHTDTLWHRNAGPRDDHNPGQQCTTCHPHAPADTAWGFAPVPHPDSTSDCGTCHLSPSTGTLDLPWIHGGECSLCHPNGPGATFLGPVGTWTGACEDCHRPGITQTGNADIPTKGHRCAVCHGTPQSLGNVQTMHHNHAPRTNCVVCHGSIPDVGLTIGTGDRGVCDLCHAPGSKGNPSIASLHYAHPNRGLSCMECHNGERPPIDVATGPAIGASTVVCQVCHGPSASGWGTNGSTTVHEKHAGRAMDCGHCHIDAELQDDRLPMPPVDDAMRAQLNRAGKGECAHCHGNTPSGSTTSIHTRHATTRAQWCWTCHEGTDQRPAGGGATQATPATSCTLCHAGRSYTSSTPFTVHRDHSGLRTRVKCYTCHQSVPPLTGWPLSWL